MIESVICHVPSLHVGKCFLVIGVAFYLVFLWVSCTWLQSIHEPYTVIFQSKIQSKYFRKSA